MREPRFYNSTFFKCPISNIGNPRFQELYSLLFNEGYKCIDSDTDLYQGQNGFYIKVGSSGGGDNWIIKLWDAGSSPKFYWSKSLLIERLNEDPIFIRIK